MDETQSINLISPPLLAHTDLLSRPQQYKLIARLGYRKIFLSKANKLMVMQVMEGQDKRGKWIQGRDSYAQGIQRYKQRNGWADIQRSQSINLSQGIGKMKKDARQSLRESGLYFLNNYINPQTHLLPPSPPTSLSSLCYALFSLDLIKCMDILPLIPSSPQSSLLAFIMEKYAKIVKLVKEDKEIKERLMGRGKWQIDDLPNEGKQVDLLQDEEQSFMKLSAAGRISCILSNLKYISSFMCPAPPSSNPYMTLLYAFLSNKYDQCIQVGIPADCSIYALLLNLPLPLLDRLNFSSLLLPPALLQVYVVELEIALGKFGMLENLWYFGRGQGEYGRNKERVEDICQKYVDQTGDIQSVAAIVSQYPFLKKYQQIYREALTFGFEVREAGRLEAFPKHTIVPLCQTNSTLINYVNPTEEKLLPIPPNAPSLQHICSICCKKVQSGQSLIICGKCGHGGHVLHMMKWWQQFQQCAGVDCPCLCN